MCPYKQKHTHTLVSFFVRLLVPLSIKPGLFSLFEVFNNVQGGSENSLYTCQSCSTDLFPKNLTSMFKKRPNVLMVLVSSNNVSMPTNQIEHRRTHSSSIIRTLRFVLMTELAKCPNPQTACRGGEQQKGSRSWTKWLLLFSRSLEPSEIQNTV